MQLREALGEAVREGIVSSAQEERLVRHFAAHGLIAGEVGDPLALSAPRDALPVNAMEEAESPRFIRGFHDILITIGAVAALSGLWGLGTVLVVLPAGFLLAEFLVRRQRLALPAFAIAVFTAVAGLYLGLMAADGFLGKAEGASGLLFAFAGMLSALGLYWLRYRVPIALAGLVLSVAVVLYSLVLLALSTPLSLDAPGAASVRTVSAIALVFALAMFATAMGFDLTDPRRLTRRSDVAFWLHLMTAPLLMYSLFGVLLGSEAGAIWWSEEPDARDAAIALLIVGALVLTGIAIDRRAFVTAGLISLGAALYTLIARNGMDFTNLFAFTVFAVGIIVLVLGTGWQRLRRVILAVLPAPVAQALPPAG
jgi:hypothetical protein